MTWTPVNVFEKSIGATQDTYSPRFVAYLARFLVNYDRCVSVCARARVRVCVHAGSREALQLSTLFGLSQQPQQAAFCF